MKTLYLLFSFILAGNLFAMGQIDRGSQLMIASEDTCLILEEKSGKDSMSEDESDNSINFRRPAVIGGFREIEPTSLEEGIVRFISHANRSNVNNSSDITIIRVFAQSVRGVKYIVCGRHEDGILSVWIIHRALSGEYELLENYAGENIFGFFAKFIVS